MYKEAIRMDLRIPSNKGLLTLQQVATLSLSELDTLAVSLQEAYENSKGKSFLDKKTTKDKTIKLQFDIVLDLLQTKAAEEETARTTQENKAFKNKVLEIIAEKKDNELASKSIKELEKLIKDNE